MSFVKEIPASLRWFLTGGLSFVVMFILGFWTLNPDDTHPWLDATVACLVVIVFLSVFKGFSWVGHETDLQKFLGLKGNFWFSTWNLDDMNYLRPLVTEKMGEIFNNILALKTRLDEVLSEEEFESCRQSIRQQRALYEKQRKLVRRFGFEMRSERKRLKSLRK